MIELIVTNVILLVLIIAISFAYPKTAGVLKIDHSDPEKDVYRFEIDNLEKLNSKKRISIKIDHDADLSQK